MFSSFAVLFEGLFSEVFAHRSFTRRTNFNPDQTSVTAHTFTSTSPAASPTSRTVFSSTSVATPELFLGQLTHSMPAGASSSLLRLNSLQRTVFDFVNSMAKSSGVFPPAVSQPALGLTSPSFTGRWSESTSHGAPGPGNSSDRWEQFQWCGNGRRP